jgi:hypothetical protein
MAPSGSGSRLFYHGTRDDVRIGDRVRIKRWFRRDLVGTVCYIPGVCKWHRLLRNDHWGILVDDGSVLAAGYHPDRPHWQPSKNISLIGRGEGGEFQPNEEPA